MFRIARTYLVILALVLSGLSGPADAQDSGFPVSDIDDLFAPPTPQQVERKLKEADAGDARAQWYVGLRFQEGLVLPKDYKKAVSYFRLSAEQGDDWGQNQLGLAYRDGKGVIQHYQIAHMWLNISSSNGNPVATSERAKLETRMSKEQIADAQDLAKRCLASGYRRCD